MSPGVINTVWGELGEEDFVWLECTSYRLAGARGKQFADSMKQFTSVSINTEYNSFVCFLLGNSLVSEIYMPF
jgi:hypothetical protein